MDGEPIEFSVKKAALLEAKILLPVLAFVIPLVFSGPQWITGTIVNALLFIASEKLTGKQLYPVLVLPSLGAVAHGVLFGPQTVFLYYFLPFIWFGNYLLAVVFSQTKGKNYLIRISLSALAKYLLLQTMAQIYFQNAIVPKIFVSSMGYIQLLTAFFGGIVSYITLHYFSKIHE